MATTTATASITGTGLQELAKRHLWMHFTRHGAYEHGEVPIIARGEGSYVWDEHGNRYLDGLSALFCVNAGHGRAEIGEAAKRQIEELGFYTNRTKLIARETAYHGTTFGALTATGITALRSTFEPLVPSGRHVPNTNSYRWPADRD